MRILDFCAGIGQWPFRRLPRRSADEVLAVMDEHGIERAVVSSLEAVLYKNCQSGNEDLAEAVAAHPDRFIPFACLNPTFPGAVRDLQRCVEQLGMRGVKLYPNYHDYSLTTDAVSGWLEVAQQLDMIVVPVVRVEDERFHHWRVLVPPTPIEDIIGLIERFPGLRFVVSGANYAEIGRLHEELSEQPDWRVELSYLKSPLHAVQTVVESHGPDRLLFGSNIPVFYAAAQVRKVADARVPAETKDRILFDNAHRLLRA